MGRIIFTHFQSHRARVITPSSDCGQVGNNMAQSTILEIERFVIESMDTPFAPDLKVAHDFKHVDRVRGWALQIAAREGFENRGLVEATALLHDIGLVYVEQRCQHAQVGAEIAAQFLRERKLFDEQEADAICHAIRCHSSPGGGGILGEILRDADKLDAIGAAGIMRAFTSKYAKPEYAPRNVKGDTWEMTMQEFEGRFAEGQGIGDHIIDQVNFQISFYGALETETAKEIGRPMVEFMGAYVIQLEAEINAAQHNGSGE